MKFHVEENIFDEDGNYRYSEGRDLEGTKQHVDLSEYEGDVDDLVGRVVEFDIEPTIIEASDVKLYDTCSVCQLQMPEYHYCENDGDMICESCFDGHLKVCSDCRENAT